ncbi:unnamed protein product, partial [Coregonus sp. 'balchen']
AYTGTADPIQQEEKEEEDEEEEEEDDDDDGKEHGFQGDSLDWDHQRSKIRVEGEGNGALRKGNLWEDLVDGGVKTVVKDVMCLQANPLEGAYDVVFHTEGKHDEVMKKVREVEKADVPLRCDKLGQEQLQVYMYNPHVMDEEVRAFLGRYVDNVSSARLLKDSLGFWDGRRSFQALLREDPKGLGGYLHPPALFSLGADRGTLYYARQPPFCRRCMAYGLWVGGARGEGLWRVEEVPWVWLVSTPVEGVFGSSKVVCSCSCWGEQGQERGMGEEEEERFQTRAQGQRIVGMSSGLRESGTRESGFGVWGGGALIGGRIDKVIVVYEPQLAAGRREMVDSLEPLCTTNRHLKGGLHTAPTMAVQHDEVMKKAREVEKARPICHYDVISLAKNNFRVITVYMYNPHVKDEEMRAFLGRYVDNVSSARLLKDSLGFWNGRRSFQALLREDPKGLGGYLHPPALFSLGADRGTLYYAQDVWRMVCGWEAHEAKDCGESKKCHGCGSSAHLWRECSARQKSYAAAAGGGAGAGAGDGGGRGGAVPDPSAGPEGTQSTMEEETRTAAGGEGDGQGTATAGPEGEEVPEMETEGSVGEEVPERKEKGGEEDGEDGEEPATAPEVHLRDSGDVIRFKREWDKGEWVWGMGGCTHRGYGFCLGIGR